MKGSRGARGVTRALDDADEFSKYQKIKNREKEIAPHSRHWIRITDCAWVHRGVAKEIRWQEQKGGSYPSFGTGNGDKAAPVVHCSQLP